MSVNSLRPFLPQRLALRAADIDAGQSPSHRVETRGQDKNVQVMPAGGRRDSAAGHSFDWGFPEIDKTHVVLIEDLEEVLFERRSLGAKGVNRLRRCEYLGNGGIVNSRSRLVTPEVVSGAVRSFIREDVVERANPRSQATDLPNAFKRRAPLALGHLGGRLVEGLIVEPSEGRPALSV